MRLSGATWRAQRVYGRAHITEVTDEWVDEPLAHLPLGEFHNALVLASRPADASGGARVDVSLRQSQVTAALVADGDVAATANREHDRPAAASDLNVRPPPLRGA